MSNLKDLYLSLCRWVYNNPTKVSEIESLISWGSMALHAKSGSKILPELLYSTSNLIVLHNDIAILDEPLVHGTKLKIWLSVVEYCEVLFEVTALRKGHHTHSVVLYLLQIIKCLGRLYLIKHFNEFLIPIPPFEPLNRTLILKKKLQGRPSSLRTYHQDAVHELKNDSVFTTDELYLKVMKSVYRAEIIFTLKPILHLVAMSHYGHNSWKPWLLSLFLDLISNRMLFEALVVLPKKRSIIIQRYARLLLYIFRSPMYEHIVSKPEISKIINSLIKLPIFGTILQLFCSCLKTYRDCYFYLWSH